MENDEQKYAVKVNFIQPPPTSLELSFHPILNYIVEGWWMRQTTVALGLANPTKLPVPSKNYATFDSFDAPTSVRDVTTHDNCNMFTTRNLSK